MHPPSFRALRYAVDPDRVCTIAMNRPDKRNALSAELVNELIIALDMARADDGVRAVVLTGVGTTFCAGGDLSQLDGAATWPEDALPRVGGFVELNLAFQTIGKPVIAKVRGAAMAGGLGLMCACHLALAEEDARFGLPEIKRGLWPMMIMANIFRTVPRRLGLELMLLGDSFDAAEALRIGLLNRAVPGDVLDGEVAELARRLAANPPKTTALGLGAFYAQDGMTVAEALPLLEQGLHDVIATGEVREGIAAFFAKRPPKWD